MSGTFRVMQLAREVDLPVSEVVNELKELGVEVSNKYSTVTEEEAQRLKEELDRRARPKTRETRIGGGAVIRRKKAPTPPTESGSRSSAVKSSDKLPSKPATRKKIEVPVAATVETVVPEDSKTVTKVKKPVKVEGKIEEQPVKVVEEISRISVPEENPPVISSAEIETAPEVVEEKSSEIEQEKSILNVSEVVTEVAQDDRIVEVVELKSDQVTAKEPVVEKVEPVAAVEQEEPKQTEKVEPVVETPVNVQGETEKERSVGHIRMKPEVSASPVSSEKQITKEKPERKISQGKRITHSPLPGRPEASASPLDRGPQSKPGRGPANKKKKEIDLPKLGPTGRYIVLPTKQPKNAGRNRNMPTSVDSSDSSVVTSDSSGGGRKGKGGDKESFISYKEKRKEDELLRKAGGIPRKKSKQGKPNLPPEGKRKIKIDEFMSISEMAKQMGLKATELIKKMLTLGQMVNINSTIDADTAAIVASDWGFEVENVGFQEEKILGDDITVDESLMVPRPPIITIMGHVDHGKTSLLDVIRKSDIVSKESGGITQHIGSYKVKIPSGELVFIDTPGHEAFSSMRARGASLTDIVILVVAADDGVMPQTIEAINHCRASKVPMIVAITKIDKNNASPQMVREKLTAHDLIDENWGGDTIMVEVSSVTKTGIDTLLEMVLLQSEMLELKANPQQRARGTVIEGQLDKSKGPIVNILITNGTLHVGDYVICGTYGGKVRSLVDDRGRNLKEAGPATPVEVTGLEGVPQPGDELNGVEDEKSARRILERRRDDAKQKELARKAQAKGMDAIRLAIAKGEQKQLNVVLKADVQGTMEAIRETLVRLSTEKVKVNVVQAGVGGINETDINLAITAEALVLGFRVRPASKARHKAENEGVEVKQYNVIYDIVDDVKDLMRGLLPKEKSEKLLGKIEVRQVFTIPKTGTIAGCYVLEGKVNRNCQLRVFRDNVQIFEGRVGSLKRFKDDVKEVATGYECGLGFDNYHDLKEGDIIESYEIVEIQAEL
ncbi:MAG: translation initiation factor IF-2 [Deltaproteobacteria bacterium]|nr:translation initiation factor IF-2 [Deltaproteobacteria bacterium]